MSNLEKRSNELEKENAVLQETIRRLMEENCSMKQRLAHTSPSNQPALDPPLLPPAHHVTVKPVSQQTQSAPMPNPMRPCIASESAVLQLPQQSEAIKGSPVLQAMTAIFVMLCFQILCVKSLSTSSKARSPLALQTLTKAAKHSLTTSGIQQIHPSTAISTARNQALKPISCQSKTMKYSDALQTR